VIQQIEGAREHCHPWQAIVLLVVVIPQVVEQEEVIQANPFFIGECICVHNTVRRHPGQAAMTEADCRAVVIDYDQLLDKVSIITDNGFRTWRLCTNLQSLEQHL